MKNRNSEIKNSFSSKTQENSRKDEQLTGEISKIAYQLYEKRGRVPGNELADWLDAEKIVKRR